MRPVTEAPAGPLQSGDGCMELSMEMARETVEGLAAAILTSNFLDEFFFPVGLWTQAEDPEGQASFDGNRNYPLQR